METFNNIITFLNPIIDIVLIYLLIKKNND